MGKTEKLHAAAQAYGDAKDALDRDYGNVEPDAWRGRLSAFQSAHNDLLATARDFAEASRIARTTAPAKTQVVAVTRATNSPTEVQLTTSTDRGPEEPAAA